MPCAPAAHARQPSLWSPVLVAARLDCAVPSHRLWSALACKAAQWCGSLLALCRIKCHPTPLVGQGGGRLARLRACQGPRPGFRHARSMLPLHARLRWAPGPRPVRRRLARCPVRSPGKGQAERTRDRTPPHSPLRPCAQHRRHDPRMPCIHMNRWWRLASRGARWRWVWGRPTPYNPARMPSVRWTTTTMNTPRVLAGQMRPLS